MTSWRGAYTESVKMQRKIILQRIVAFILTTISPSLSYAVNEHILSLSEAERLAISSSPELKQFQANAESLRAQAIVDGQWSDPQLIVGAANVPTNWPTVKLRPTSRQVRNI